MMTKIRDLMAARDKQREAEAALLAAETLRRLHDEGFGAWLVGSLARGEFRQHSDIDLLIDAPVHRRAQALRTCLSALAGFPSSIVFKEDVPPHALDHLLQEAAHGPNFRADTSKN